MPIFFELDASGMEQLERDLLATMKNFRGRTLRRGLSLIAQDVDKAFRSRGYSGGTAIGPSSPARESSTETIGRWAKHRPSTKKSRELWAKKHGPPAGDELRLTDDMRRAATDTTGTVKGSAAYVDEAEGDAGIGIDLDVFPGGQALQWGYTPRNLVARPFLALRTSVDRQITREAQDDLAQCADILSQRYNE